LGSGTTINGSITPLTAECGGEFIDPRPVEPPSRIPGILDKLVDGNDRRPAAGRGGLSLGFRHSRQRLQVEPSNPAMRGATVAGLGGIGLHAQGQQLTHRLEF